MEDLFNLKIVQDPVSSDFKCRECSKSFHPKYDIFNNNPIRLSNYLIWYIMVLSNQFENCVCDYCYYGAKSQNICIMCSFTTTCARCGLYIDKMHRSINICPGCLLENPLWMSKT